MTLLETQNRLLLTERRRPLTKNSLTLLFTRLSQRAGLARTPICPFMLRETNAIRFLQAGGELAALQEHLPKQPTSREIVPIHRWKGLPFPSQKSLRKPRRMRFKASSTRKEKGTPFSPP